MLRKEKVMTLVNVKMEDWELLDMLLDRCDYWGVSSENKDLFEKMYEHYLDSGLFEEGEFNVRSIVDNDAVNWCTVIHKRDYKKDFKKLLKLYKQGEYDVSCEAFEEIKPSYIEAISDDEERILIRY